MNLITSRRPDTRTRSLRSSTYGLCGHSCNRAAVTNIQPDGAGVLGKNDVIYSNVKDILGGRGKDTLSGNGSGDFISGGLGSNSVVRNLGGGMADVLNIQEYVDNNQLFWQVAVKTRRGQVLTTS